MDRKLHTWRVNLVGDNHTQVEAKLTTYWSPDYPGIRGHVMECAAASATVQARRQVVYTAVDARLVDDEVDAEVVEEPEGPVEA